MNRWDLKYTLYYPMLDCDNESQGKYINNKLRNKFKLKEEKRQFFCAENGYVSSLIDLTLVHVFMREECRNYYREFWSCWIVFEGS